MVGAKREKSPGQHGYHGMRCSGFRDGGYLGCSNSWGSNSAKVIPNHDCNILQRKFSHLETVRAQGSTASQSTGWLGKSEPPSPNREDRGEEEASYVVKTDTNVPEIPTCLGTLLGIQYACLPSLFHHSANSQEFLRFPWYGTQEIVEEN